ncbi:ArsA family ATPase [Nesterenkonia sp. CL21]|uniref:ArsA family ATPase n=1 Tax=unclassified Nesterenkonia TaxID=2629769 RepID=UPI002879DA4A|nr:ArsA family ATPase [Nesterenkonia sp. CL21]MDS2173302.1 ArsA family ATPase [Nesterenkonia sp. CL21]
MLLDLARDRRVLFIGGKGGVGKTAVASATALHRAQHSAPQGAARQGTQQGARVLVVSTDPAHNLGHLWEREVGDEVVTLWEDRGAPPGVRPARLDGVEIDPEATTAAHLADVGETLRSMMPAHLHGEVDKHLRLAARSPGTHEAAILERIAALLQDHGEDHDLIVFDTAPSGHTARLMALPEIMTAWTEGLLDRRTRAERFGAAVRALDGDDAPDGSSPAARDRRIRQVLTRRRNRFEAMRQVLSDASRCSFVIVLTAERLPVLESVELHAQLTETGVDVGGFVVNRLAPRDAGDFLAARRDQEQRHLDELGRRVPGAVVDTLPLLRGDLVGVAALERLGEHLR